MENERDLIILVDDNPANLRSGKNVLSERYIVATAPSAEKLFNLLEHNQPALILLDIDMPGMDGYEVIRILKTKPETQHIPVIFLTGKTESGDEIEGLSLGAIDYITKPFLPALLLKRIEVHLLVEAQRKTLEKQARELQYFNDHLRKAFSTYLSGEVVEEIIADPSRLQLGGIQRRMSALFTDVKDFSRIAEALSPKDLVALLNQYLSTMSDVILEQKGTIDKYEGDAIIAFFGAPLELPDHALRACTSAILMKRFEAGLNRQFIAQKKSPIPLLTRIGINTGDMVAGNMGTERKMNYTIMGSAVNLASRLEGVNKQYGTWILAAEATAQETAGRILSRRLDRIRVAGIQEPVRVYEILDIGGAVSAEDLRRVDLFHQAHALFEARDWKSAETAFAGLLNAHADDGPSRLYYRRCRLFQESPPADGWDGVFQFTGK
ncbi:MAG: response regulator [Treponema sp.]|jgi:class 3 adenylate cyclase/ActR/RegA family two-component response regulator|nr:response regulator [Treponema sp.]